MTPPNEIPARALRGIERQPADETYPERLRTAENGELQRRAAVVSDGAAREVHGAVGVALSGGGIRSATVSLGVFQGMAQQRLLRHVDFLSTVSGGGYFGAFFGRIFGRMLDRSAGAKQRLAQLSEVEGILADPTSDRAWPIRNLRENGRYLAPGGSGDLLLATGIVLRNWLSVLVVLFVALLAAFALLMLAQIWLGLTSAVPDGSIWRSGIFKTVPPVLFGLAVPLAWAYWLVPPTGRERGEHLFSWLGPLGLLVTAGVWLATAGRSPWSALREYDPLAALGAVAALAMAFYAAARIVYRAGSDALRNGLSRWLTGALVTLAGIIGVAVVDSLAQTVYLAIKRGALWPWLLTSLPALLVGIGSFGRQLAPLLEQLGAERRQSISRNLALYTGALVAGLTLLVGASIVVHGVGWRWGKPHGDVAFGEGLWMFALGATLLTCIMGRVWSFVNRSTVHPFYEARLRRAYLGASNPKRDEQNKPVVMADPDDGIPMGLYQPQRHGGPIHLINVTVNETVSGQSQVQQQDRKGMGMAVGPCGVSLGRRHHARWDQPPELESFVKRASGRLQRRLPSSVRKMLSLKEKTEPGKFYVFPPTESFVPEALDLGHWVAISGAAFSTGLGYRTSLALSLLAGLFNIRLGYWWDSGITSDRAHETRVPGSIQLERLLAKVVPVHASLGQELLARFPGVARRRWYLSDGGHFENLATYELIRRRLPLIVVCDNEQDARYRFEGLGNLVRKARVDFETEIAFLDEAELTNVLDEECRRWIGTLEDLERGARSADRSGFSRAHAALATIEYPQASKGVLLYLKPTLLGNEPVDLIHYQSEHPEYPHERTLDQFFDEAQWESYRRLGELMATRVFGGVPGGAWHPAAALSDPVRSTQRLFEQVRRPR